MRGRHSSISLGRGSTQAGSFSPTPTSLPTSPTSHIGISRPEGRRELSWDTPGEPPSVGERFIQSINKHLLSTYYEALTGLGLRVRAVNRQGCCPQGTDTLVQEIDPK